MVFLWVLFIERKAQSQPDVEVQRLFPINRFHSATVPEMVGHSRLGIQSDAFPQPVLDAGGRTYRPLQRFYGQPVLATLLN